MLTDKEFNETEIGQRVAMVTGPGQFPAIGLCEAEGTIIEKVINKWGKHFLVKFDGEEGYIDTMHDITTSGIGIYLLEQ